MTGFGFGDPIGTHLDAFCAEIEQGAAPMDVESDWVDAKEEAGRRQGTRVVPGQPENEEAARVIAKAAACFANGMHGGAVLVGIADDGQAIGTQLDPEWVRSRVRELTAGEVIPYVEVRTVRGIRCLGVHVQRAHRPVRVGGRVRMRVDDDCVTVPDGHWFRSRADVGEFDWSRELSGKTLDDASPSALEVARRLLRESGETAAQDLATADDRSFLTRLGVLDADGNLTNAGALLFTATGEPALDFLRRQRAGMPSDVRVHRGDVSALEQVTEVFTAMQVAVSIIQVADAGGAVVGQLPSLPLRARREAIMNAVAHRDWFTGVPVSVELTDQTLVVTSPGGLVGGVTTKNIITHPPARRSPHLTEVLAKLRLAEREAIGVDTMYREMLRDGHPPPDITDDHDRVRVVLVGGRPDERWLRVVRLLEPQELRGDLNASLLLHELKTRGFVTVSTAAAVLQRSHAEARVALEELAGATLEGSRILVGVDGDPDPDDDPAYRLDPRDLLGTARGAGGNVRRLALLAEYAEVRGRVSSREAEDLTGVTRPTAISDLDRLVEDGTLRHAGAGPTAHYRLAEPAE